MTAFDNKAVKFVQSLTSQKQTLAGSTTIREFANRHRVDINKLSSALACPSRLAIICWLKSPAEHFPPQVHADINAVGVCGAFFAEKLGVTAATASAHLRILVDVGLVSSTRIGKWTYFKRNDGTLAAFSASLAKL